MDIMSTLLSFLPPGGHPAGGPPGGGGGGFCVCERSLVRVRRVGVFRVEQWACC